jgi:GNAT superfamily N-acetyltransferase
VKIEKWDGSSKDKNNILSLMKTVFGENEYSTQAYFNWIYEKNPQGDPIVLFARDEKDDSIIGIETIIPMNLWVGKKIIKSALSCNSAVNPNFRNKGIFGVLVDEIQRLAKEEKISCIYGVPNRNSYHAFVKRGFYEIGKLKIYGKPLKISKYFGDEIILKPLDYLIRKENNQTKFESFKEDFDSKFDDLFNKKIDFDGVITNKTKDFLNWRYKQHPTREYETFSFQDKDQLLSYIVLRKTIFKNKKVVVIVDFVIDPRISEFKEITKFVSSVLNNYREDCIAVIVTCNPEFKEYQILKNLGFMNIPKIFKPEPFYFITSILEPFNGQRKFQVFNNWVFCFGDYDVF